MRKEATKKYKINIIDILVVLLALVCIVSVVLRFFSTREVKEFYASREHLVYFQIDDIRSSSYSFFDGHSGEIVRFKSDGKILGTLGADFSRGVAIHTYNENKDGNIIKTEYYYPEPKDDVSYSEDRCSINGYIIVSGKMVNDVLWIDEETSLSVNQILETTTEHIEMSIRITNVVEKTE